MSDTRSNPAPPEPAIDNPATRRYFRLHFGLILLYLVLLVGTDIVAIHVIDARSDLDDPGVLYTIAILAFILTFVLYFWLAMWLLILTSRRFAVADSYWEPAQATVAVAKMGFLRARVIGIRTSDGTEPLLVFSGALFSSGYRRQVADSHSICRLRRRSGGYRGPYAVPSGGRLFSSQSALLAGANSAWRHRALDALGDAG